MAEERASTVGADAPTGRRIAAALLLGGGIRPSALGYAAGCSTLDLEIEPGVSVLRRWCEIWRRSRLLEKSSLRVLAARGAPAPVCVDGTGPLDVALRTDEREFCGPAGSVRDAVADLPDDAMVVVHEAAVAPACDVNAAVGAAASLDADAVVFVNPDGAAAGMYLFRAGQFRAVSRIGFTDLKEQFLPSLRSKGARISTLALPERGLLRLGTRLEFLEAGRALAGRPINEGSSAALSAMGGEGPMLCPDSWRSPGSSVARSAVVLRSFIMAGATVDEQAVIVRSVVCPGARAPAGAQIVDAVVSREGVRHDDWAEAKRRWRRRL